MITSVEVRNAAGTLLTLSLEDPSSGYEVRDIGGLDPVNATLVSSSFAGVDGTQYQSARREGRNLTMKLGFSPDYILSSVRSLRNNLYNWFTPKQPVFLKFFMDDDLEVNISGRVESCVTPLFAEDPQVDISIMCFDPDFVEEDAIVEEGFTVATTDEFFINYAGTVDTGMIFVLELNRDITGFVIYHTPPDGTSRIFTFDAALLSGDILTINSIRGSKGITLNRSGVISNLLYGRSPSSAWLELQHGFNNFRVYVTGAPIPFSMTYMNRYGGL